jgi:hypothetical protein
MRLHLARDPERLVATHPLIIEDLLGLAEAGKQEAVDMMITMLSDLHQQGRGSRYLRAMTGTPIWELKSRSRGGLKGGSRVYLFLNEHDEAGIVNCEAKDGDEASRNKLMVVLRVIRAYKAGVPVFRSPDPGAVR